MDEFKRSLLHFRRRPQDPDRVEDLHELIDFAQGEGSGSGHTTVWRVRLDTVAASSIDCYQGDLFTLRDFPGFLYAPNALSASAQLQLAHQAVQSYCEAPFVTNIQLVPPKPHEHPPVVSMWELWKKEQSQGISCQPYYLNFHKLAWATMGYHYDWTARAYPKEMASIIPDNLVRLSQYFAKTSLMYDRLGDASPQSPSDPDAALRFAPTAAIVNYYHAKSVMGPHRDDSEHAVDKPIVSLSLGRPAVFLLGGGSRSDAVAPLLVRPGDVMILGGAARLNYHAMARLLPAHVAVGPAGAPADSPAAGPVERIEGMPVPPEAERAALEQYLAGHRININLRQVFADGNG